MKTLLTLLLAVVFAIGVSALSPAVAQTKPESPAKGASPGTTKTETKTETTKTETKSEKPATSRSKTTQTKKQVDLNTASADELKDLPGVGEEYSKKIVENRPYKRKDELVQKNVLPQATYDTIKNQVVARQPAAAKKSGDTKSGSATKSTQTKKTEKSTETKSMEKPAKP